MSNIRAIRTEADYKAALARVDALMDADFGTQEGEELDVLIDLIELYEVRHVPMVFDGARGVALSDGASRISGARPDPLSAVGRKCPRSCPASAL